MCGDREGVARSCARVFAHVVGARIAVSCVVSCALCMCGVCAGMQPEAARWAPTRRRAVEQARSQRCAPEKYNFDFLKLTRLIQPRRSLSTRHRTGKRHDHPHITRRKRLKLHADNSNMFTSYWSHEQHKYNAQADDPLNCTSGAYCSLQTPKSACLLFDAFAGRDTTRVSRSVEDAAFDAQRSRQLTGRRWRLKIRAREPSQGSRGFTRPKESSCITR